VPPTIVTVSGSLRTESIHTFLLTNAETLLSQAGATVVRLDLADAPHYNEDIDTPDHRWAASLRAQVSAASGLLIATPTFNYTVPSTIKTFIDWLSRPWGASAFAGRRLALITASPGPAAGMPGAEYVIKMAGALKAELVEPHTHVGKVGDHVNVAENRIAPTVQSQLQATITALLAPQIVIAKHDSYWSLAVDGVEAVIADYRMIGDVISLPHTETLPAYRGNGYAARLVSHILDDALAQGRKVIPSCPFVADFIRDHEQYHVLVR
jgi:NAD(P)H-dependent FMN reductase